MRLIFVLEHVHFRSSMDWNTRFAISVGSSTITRCDILRLRRRRWRWSWPSERSACILDLRTLSFTRITVLYSSLIGWQVQIRNFCDGVWNYSSFLSRFGIVLAKTIYYLTF